MGKAQVYLDLLFITVLGMSFVAFITLTAMNAKGRIEEMMIREESALLAGQIYTAIARYIELGKANPIRPENGTAELLGVLDLGLPPRLVGRNYEIIFLSPNGTWIGIGDVKIDGNVSDFLINETNSKIAIKTVEEPALINNQSMPNLNVLLLGKYRSGELPYLRYYRYNINETIVDIVSLSPLRLPIK